MSRGPLAPRGWVAAPDLIAQEIRLLWQEDEMPEELKSSPGYSSFTLSPEAQAWVDAMLEVTEHHDKRGSLVIGRPKPVVQREHRIRAAPPPNRRDEFVDSAAPVFIPERRYETPTPAPPPPPKKIPPRPMPQVDPGKSVPLEPTPGLSTQQPRAMPDVNPGTSGSPVDKSSNQPTAPRPTPQIGAGLPASSDGVPASEIHPPRGLPTIETDRTGEAVGDPHSVFQEEARALPDIGTVSIEEEGPPEPRPMPDIG